MTISQKIIKRIISDNDFSLSLLLPNCIEFYKQNGYSDDEIIEKQPGRKSS